jgi:putative addiction module component (TIGR02574 family)
MSKTEILEEIRKLTFTERVELLEELWIEAETERPQLLDWQRDLLDARLAEAEEHPEDWTTWEESKRRLEGLLPDRG